MRKFKGIEVNENEVRITTLENGSTRIYDKNNNLIYREYSNGFWAKWKYDECDNLIHYEDSDGDWWKWTYDEYGKLINSESGRKEE